MQPEMKELVERFKPHVLWSDGDWEASSEYFGSKEFLAWLYNESPVKDFIVTNDRKFNYFEVRTQKVWILQVEFQIADGALVVEWPTVVFGQVRTGGPQVQLPITYTQIRHYSNLHDLDQGVLIDHKWENAMTVDRKSWGSRKNLVLEDILDPSVRTCFCSQRLAHYFAPNFTRNS